MRISFITLSCSHNYGAVLQTYALYSYLAEKGHDVQLIDYITERYQIDAPDYVYRSTKRWSKNALTRYAWRHTKHRSELKCRDCFRSFLKKYIKMTKIYYDNRELLGDTPRADVFMTGSDQIWNTDFSWDHKIDLPYFLDFVPEKTPMIAYASSFGKKTLGPEEADDVRAHLMRFTALGVREKEGKNIIESLGLKADVVVDPTLLCKSDVWERLIAPRAEKQPYLLLFQIFPDKHLLDTAKEIAARKRLKLIVVSGNPMDLMKIRYPAVFLPPVEQWLSYFRYADFVITDSFHATVFSILFKRQFLSSTRAIYSSRISGFLSRIGAGERAVEGVTLEAVRGALEKDVDYETINVKQRELVAESERWLENALSTCGEIR